MSGNFQPEFQPNNFPQLGQAFVQGFMNFLANQQGALQQGAVQQGEQSSPANPSLFSLPPSLTSAFPSFQNVPDNELMAQLRQEFSAQHTALWNAMLQRKPGEPGVTVVAPEPSDKRFSSSAWVEPYYDYVRQAYLINADFLTKLTGAIPSEDEAAKNKLQFFTKQYIDAMAPSNFAATNPDFVKTAIETNGASITEGIKNLIADMEKGRVSMTDDTAFVVGKNLAVSPGEVVFENELMQLIQYAPATDKVCVRPLLIVPPCINKFYILDLQPENSYVKYAVEQGMTVFLVSWRNPQAEQSHFGWDDFVEQGPLAAIDVVREIAGVEQINALGFCVGGTILSSALSVAKARGEDPVASLTLLTTLLDFSDGGEIVNFVDEASVAAREASIGKKGLMHGSELAAAFSALRANDLIWPYVVGNYLKGNKPSAFDLLYWNSDSTNLPGPFAVWYLRNLYMENSLRVPGKLSICGEENDLSRLTMPAYILATREDHIVPWRTAYHSRAIVGGETTFVLGASGHIAGVVNPASKNKRSFWTGDSNSDRIKHSSEDWLASANEHKGSWWPHWMTWLKQFGGEERAARKKLGSKIHKPIEAAPGRYVQEKL